MRTGGCVTEAFAKGTTKVGTIENTCAEAFIKIRERLNQLSSLQFTSKHAVTVKKPLQEYFNLPKHCVGINSIVKGFYY